MVEGLLLIHTEVADISLSLGRNTVFTTLCCLFVDSKTSRILLLATPHPINLHLHLHLY